MGHALLTLGDLHWLRGEADRAIPFWHRALIVGSQLADPRGIAGPIERLAWGMTRRGQFESAAWLFGAADAQYRMLGVALRHDEELDHDDLMCQTRQNLGRAFDKAWSDGQASTVEEAVDLALQLANPSVKWSAPYSI
jgi:non-specific serine/threonine protein kinase